LGEEVLHLLDVQKPISTYDLSTPPTVFVRKGKYENGALNLQVINTNATGNVGFDAGFRTTETSDFENSSSSLDLNGNYITNLSVPTGNLFDIGFRIGDGIATPDDLFMSDGPWGIDDSEASTTVNSYTVSPNAYNFDSEAFPIERNVTINANTNTYVAAYRALTPRFKAVDVSGYDNFNLTASGTGNLEITFVKASISDWAEQYKTTISLTETEQEFNIPLANFVSTTGSDIELNDVVTIVFTMVSENGQMVTKVMNLQQVYFSNESTLSVVAIENETKNIAAIPNPMTTQTNIHFTANQSENVQFVMYDQVGKIVFKAQITTEHGQNKIPLNRQNLRSGLYFCKIIGSKQTYKTIKLIVR
jgi:hypothetical protein